MSTTDHDDWRVGLHLLSSGLVLDQRHRESLLEKGLVFVKADGTTLALTNAGRAWTNQGRPVIVARHPYRGWRVMVRKSALPLLGMGGQGTQRDRPYESVAYNRSHARALAYAAHLADRLPRRKN